MTVGPAPNKSILSVISDMVVNLPTAIDDVVAYLRDFRHDEAMVSAVTALISRAGTDAHNVLKGPENLGGLFSQAIGSPIVDLIFRESLNVNIDAGDRDTKAIFNVISRMVGFTILLTYSMAALEMVGKALGANRWAEHGIKAIAELPHEMGVSWAIGSTAADIFSYIIDGPVKEYINTIYHPARIEWPQVRTLLKQRHLTGSEFYKRMDNLGFRREDADLLLKAEDAKLTTSELQGAYVQGLMVRGQVEAYLEDLGYSRDDASTLVTLYLDRAETQAGALYRSTAERAFRMYQIDEAQFRGLLQHLDVPQRSIDIEVSAIRLDQQVGAQNLTVTDIRTLWEDGSMATAQARSELLGLGYTEASVTNLFRLWQDELAAKSKKIPYVRVLSYMQDGAMTTQEAYEYLVNDGFRAQDARFLVEHPDTKTPKPKKEPDVTTIMTAYKDGLLTVGQVQTKLAALNLAADDISLQIQKANYQIAQKNKKKAAPKELSVGDIKAMFKYGIFKPQQALNELESIGYSSLDATFLQVLWDLELQYGDTGPPGPGPGHV